MRAKVSLDTKLNVNVFAFLSRFRSREGNDYTFYCHNNCNIIQKTHRVHLYWLNHSKCNRKQLDISTITSLFFGKEKLDVETFIQMKEKSINYNLPVMSYRSYKFKSI